MENSKFGGGSNIQFSIPTRLELLKSNDRIDVVQKTDEMVSGLFCSYIDGQLVMTVVGTDEKIIINVDDIKALGVPQSTARVV